MTRIRSFQLLVVLSTLLCVAWYALPHLPLTLAPEIEGLLQANGAGGSQVVREPWFYNAAFIARLVAGVALFLFLAWGRWLLGAVLFSDLASVLVGGVAVTLPLDQFVYVLMYLCEGALVALAFSEPLASAFRGIRGQSAKNEA